MANADIPSGARLVGHLTTAPHNARIRSYTVLAADAVAIFLGDFVKHTGTAAVNEEGVYLPVCAQAEAADKIVGVAVGLVPSREYENQVYRTASTLRTVLVCDDPDAIFEIQTSGTTAAADIGLNADVTVGTGSTVTGLSAMELDQTSVDVTATLQLRILGLVNRADNVIGAAAKLQIMINYHQFKANIVGI